jgi:hypothetical protein
MTGAVMIVTVPVVGALVATAVGVGEGVIVGVEEGVKVGIGVAVGSGVRVGTRVGLSRVGGASDSCMDGTVGSGASCRGRAIIHNAAMDTRTSTTNPRSSHGFRLCIDYLSVNHHSQEQVYCPLRPVLYPIEYRLAS